MRSASEEQVGNGELRSRVAVWRRKAGTTVSKALAFRTVLPYTCVA